MRVSAFELDVRHGCAHGRLLGDECYLCDDWSPQYRHPRPGTYRNDFGRLLYHSFAGPSAFIRCPHGALVPFGTDEYARRLPDVGRAFSRMPGARPDTFCSTCEADRKLGREQEDAVKALCRSLPRPVRVPKGIRPAYDAAHEAWLRGEIESFGYSKDRGLWTE